MNLGSIIIAIALIFSPHLYAGNFFQLNKEPLEINQCPIVTTGNPFDFAILNDGYFVISKGKSNDEKFFTRYGMIMLDKNYYLGTNTGHYLLAVNPLSDAKHLSKIKIPMRNMPPRATTQTRISVNLPSFAVRDDKYSSSSILYDSLGNASNLNLKFEKIDSGRWQVIATVDSVERDSGELIFNSAGKLLRQKGLNHVQWPANYGMHELKIDLTSCTQFANPFIFNEVNHDGYPMGILSGMNVNWDGAVVLIYSNGKSRVLKNRIAIAKFTNPRYLEHISGYIYRTSEKSGNPMIHWTNSEGSIISGALEVESCWRN